MFKSIQQLLGLNKRQWTSIDNILYTKAYQQYGGSFITHPDVITTLSTLTDMPLSFLGQYENNQLVGAIPIWGKYLAGSKTALKHAGKKKIIDTGNPQVTLPLATNHSFHLPVKAEGITLHHKTQITNLKPSKLKALAIAKNPQKDWRKKFRYNRSRELKAFQAANGRLEPIEALSPTQIASHYLTLFEKRWGFPACSAPYMHKNLTVLAPWLTGHTLQIQGNIIAIQILYAIETPFYFTVEFINGGYDPTWQQYSPGSILTYLNVSQAANTAKKLGKPLRYSFGKADNNYKKYWCHTEPLYRV